MKIFALVIIGIVICGRVVVLEGEETVPESMVLIFAH